MRRQHHQPAGGQRHMRRQHHQPAGGAVPGDAPLVQQPQRRRLALARLELGRAALWLLDEPTLGLDTASVARLEGRIARHRAAGGLVMLATHVPLALDGARGLALQDYAAEELPL
ncbi:hypothetical protein BWR60_12550 [Inquilinus limosus]|uniref:ABC transporter domain-containing protein n=2 Tax=Inquilinus limosus TaxID=171674 RepID=A0A211ZNQ1_9PROT|nr:hypothetical protein BWR60_12550 [Inquilinus limosus]